MSDEEAEPASDSCQSDQRVRERSDKQTTGNKGWACSPLPDAEDDARTGAQQVLFVALAIGQLGTQVVGLDGADGYFSFDGLVVK